MQEEYMFNKREFWDLVNIRYGWPLSRTPRNCTCGNNLNIENPLTCKTDGFITLRHNRLRNITASLLKEVCHDVQIEPTLQKLTGEQFELRAAKTTDEPRFDVAARGFWVVDQIAFFDIGVFYSNATRYTKVANVEQGCFTTLVFSASGGMGHGVPEVLHSIS